MYYKGPSLSWYLYLVVFLINSKIVTYGIKHHYTCILQLCCFNDKGSDTSYIDSAPNVGFKTKWNPDNHPTNYLTDDKAYHDICCSAGLCDKFYEVRPANNQCFPYIDFQSGKLSGTFIGYDHTI